MTPKKETVIAKHLPAVQVRHQAGNCWATVSTEESVPRNHWEIRKDFHHLTRGHDP